MILRFFDSGISKGSSPIRYLLGKNNSDGSERFPPPTLISGQPETTRSLIDAIERKYKYTSGVVSFRDDEHPTNTQVAKIIKDFRATFAPGMPEDRYNMLWVMHRHAGNTELHFVGVMEDLKTGKQYNIMPPGKAGKQLASDWQASWNHKLGFDQVVEDPLKTIFSSLDLKVAKHLSPTSLPSKKFRFKQKISGLVAEKIRSGEFKDRTDLVQFFEDAGLEVTRQGKDYISIKSKNQPKAKAIRLKGKPYSADVDYRDLLKQVDQDSQKQKNLTDTEAFLVDLRLQKAVTDRKAFIKSREPKPKKPKKAFALPGHPKPQKRTKVGQKVSKQMARTKVLEKISQLRNEPSTPKNDPSIYIEQKNLDQKLVPQNSPTPEKKSPKQRMSSQNAKGGSSGGVQDLGTSLGAIEEQIRGAVIKMNSARTPEERAKAQVQLHILQRRKMELEIRIQEQKKREMNMPTPKPPGFT